MTKSVCKVISVFQKKTTMRLSEIEWSALKEICEHEKMKRKTLLEMVDKYRHENLSFTSAVRVFELAYFLCKCSYWLLHTLQRLYHIYLIYLSRNNDIYQNRN